ncbi:768_t:CDS:2 [Funneliformis geosporum]|uniref:12940_t:CDS:1 n=1 Tax=Funneliformis geosporum TaxID=1117311 RepID=A0A9W4WU10_9GLOM|nr:768_t:CDS:2 [Funneliformis geosporum]CAI2178883.1 12940_t:CDS:2 [Funneliformis geosporum]
MTNLANNDTFSEVTKKDLEWSLPPGSSTETQTFYLATNEGHFAFVQMIHSNIGVWKPTIQFTTRFYGGGMNTFKSVNMSHFKLSGDRLSAEADNMSIKLNPECNKYKVTLKHDKDLSIDFEFERVDRGFRKKNGGKTYFGKKESEYVEHKFWPKGIVKGKIMVDGNEFDLSGVGLFVHAIQGMRPHLIASSWNFVNFQSTDVSLSMCEFKTTPHYGSKKSNQGGLVINNKLVGVSVDNVAEFLETNLDPKTKYHIPSKIRYTWKGKTLEENEDFSASIEIKIGTPIDIIDVLNEIPYVLKKIVQAFVAKPFVYQWFNEADAHIKIGDKEELVARGTLFSEYKAIGIIR